jgi:hypothetical protein
VVQQAVVLAQGIIVIVPESLQSLLFTGQMTILAVEDIPARLLAAVTETAAPRRLGNLAGSDQQAQRTAEDQGKAFHRDSFDISLRLARYQATGCHVCPACSLLDFDIDAAKSKTRCGLVPDRVAASSTDKIGVTGIEVRQNRAILPRVELACCLFSVPLAKRARLA